MTDRVKVGVDNKGDAKSADDTRGNDTHAAGEDASVQLDVAVRLFGKGEREGDGEGGEGGARGVGDGIRAAGGERMGGDGGSEREG